MEEVLARLGLKRVGRHWKGRCRADRVKFYPPGSREPLNVIWWKSAVLRVVVLKLWKCGGRVRRGRTCGGGL